MSIGGDDPPPLSLRSPTLDPSLGLKNCPPLRVKKVGLYPPKHFEYPYPWTPPRRPRPKKNFCRSAANLSYIFGKPNIRSHGNYPKNIKNWKKNHIWKITPLPFWFSTCTYPLPPLNKKLVSLPSPPPWVKNHPYPWTPLWRWKIFWKFIPPLDFNPWTRMVCENAQ